MQVFRMTGEEEGLDFLVLVCGTEIYGDLQVIPKRLEALLLDPSQGGKVIDRLFPPAYRSNPDAEAEHRRLLGESLWERRREQLQLFERQLKASLRSEEHVFVRIALEDADLWLRVINDLRLLLGTELDLQAGFDHDEPPADPALYASWRDYGILSGLQTEILHALGAEEPDLPEEPENAGDSEVD